MTRSSFSASNVATCRIGPNTSRSISPMPDTRNTCGATKRPPAAGASTLAISLPFASMRGRSSREIEPRASSSMTGPTSVAIDQGSPTLSSSIAPLSISSTFFSTSFWT